MGCLILVQTLPTSMIIRLWNQYLPGGDQLSPGEWISYALFELLVSFIIAKCKKYVEREREFQERIYKNMQN